MWIGFVMLQESEYFLGQPVFAFYRCFPNVFFIVSTTRSASPFVSVEVVSETYRCL